METISIALLISLACFATYFLLRDPRQKGLPPGPRPWPILGNLHQLGHRPHAHLAMLAQSYGQLFTFMLGSQPVVVASSPAAAAEILKNQDRIFSGRYVFQSFRIDNHVEHSLIWSDCNDYWKMIRRICKTVLFSPKMIESQTQMREDKVFDMVGYLRSKEGEVVNIPEVVFGTLFNIFGNLIYSKDVFDLADPTGGEIKGQMWRLMDLGNATNPADFYPILGKIDLLGKRRAVSDCLQEIYLVWNAILRERREKKDTDSTHQYDFVHVLLESNLNDYQINALLMEIFGAGTETTVSTIEWALTEIIRNKEILTKVRSELEAVVGDKMVKESDLPSLPYLRACIKETMRLHPVTPLLLPHRALEDCQLLGYKIPKDCRMAVNVWAIGRDPTIWDDPLTFSPDRFFNSSLDYKGKDFEFIPFGAGRRICPGIPLATQFVHFILASLVHNFEWSLPNGMCPTELVMDEKFGLTLQKDPPLFAIPKASV